MFGFITRKSHDEIVGARNDRIRELVFCVTCLEQNVENYKQIVGGYERLIEEHEKVTYEKDTKIWSLEYENAQLKKNNGLCNLCKDVFDAKEPEVQHV